MIYLASCYMLGFGAKFKETLVCTEEGIKCGRGGVNNKNYSKW